MKKLVIDCRTGEATEVDITPEEAAQAEADADKLAELESGS
jgi:hypothetical protein